jgi:hypothetical protein
VCCFYFGYVTIMHTFFKIIFIHGEFCDRIRLVRIGACLFAIVKNLLFHSAYIRLGSWMLDRL